jgi:hypothetical protein
LASNPPIPPSGNSIAAREAAQQEGFLREVDEALREEQVMGLLSRYGKPLGLAIVLGLAGLGGYLWWDKSREDQAADSAVKTLTALEQLTGGNRDAASKELTGLSKDGPDGSRAVAALTLAGIAADQGKTEEAAKAFAKVAADSSVPQPFRDLATLREMGVRFDAAPPAEVIAKLKPLAVPGNAWFGPAGELVAMAYLKQNKPELAGPLLAAIAKDKDTPETLRARARQLAAQLGYDAVDDVKKLLGGESAAATPAP